ncbi:MAG: peptidoglycan editing factor PgeF [Mycobacterium leprae]
MRSVDLGAGVAAAITDRTGGTSAPPYDGNNLGRCVGDDPAAVAANRAATAAALALDASRVVWMAQVHAARVTVVDSPRPDPVAVTDALVTATPSLALAVLVADCAPVLLADPAARVVAAAHAGRRGLAAAVVPRAVAAMLDGGARPGDVRAFVGPTICGGCYEVPGPLQEEVAARVPGSACTTRRGTPGLDLRSGLIGQLHDAGIDAVDVDPTCPAEHPAYFSYRRDGTTGRFAGYVWLRP